MVPSCCKVATLSWCDAEMGDKFKDVVAWTRIFSFEEEGKILIFFGFAPKHSPMGITDHGVNGP